MNDPTADLADRVRVALAKRDDVSERRMMGGIVFMVSGHMCCGADAPCRGVAHASSLPPKQRGERVA